MTSGVYCRTCGEEMSGDGYRVVLHCPGAQDYESHEPDAAPVHCVESGASGITDDDPSKVLLDAQRWRAFRKCVATNDVGFLERVQEYVQSVGYGPEESEGDDHEIPEHVIDATNDAARGYSNEQKEENT